ncbi:MAG: VOC family protein, partial [Pseudoleptotrichia goodfellowii]|nr:VOC family protein [Pseudoleptotrichia goodfellowii]
MDSKLNIKDFDNFFLYVDDLKKAKEYYENKLGLKVKFDFSEMGMVAFNVGNNEPAIILKDKKKYPDSKPVIWFVVDDVLKEYDKMSID